MTSIKNKSLEERKEISNNFISSDNNIIPVILEYNKNSKIKLSKYKYLVKNRYYLAIFINKVKEMNNIKKETALIIKSKNIILNQNTTMEDIYNTYKDKDDFLYISIEHLNSFG